VASSEGSCPVWVWVGGAELKDIPALFKGAHIFSLLNARRLESKIFTKEHTNLIAIKILFTTLGKIDSFRPFCEQSRGFGHPSEIALILALHKGEP
jgi:hypothetical protein